MGTASRSVTQMLVDWSQGRTEVLDELMPVVYAELRRLAQRHLQRERPGHTLQATALVHEAYLQLIDQRQVHWQNRAHFFALAAQLMRRILVTYARSRHRLKRGGAQTKLTLGAALATAATPDVDLVALDDALRALAKLDAQQSRIVELRYFGGLTIEETAAVLGVSPATVKNKWSMARAWLHCELHRGGRHDT